MSEDRWPFPFPRGTPPFRGESRFSTIDALRDGSEPWMLDFLQMGPWPWAATASSVFTGRILLVVTSYPGPFLVRGTIPPGACTISTPLLPGGKMFNHGRAITENQIVIQRSGGDVDFHALGPVRMLAATIAAGFFEESVGARMGDAFQPRRGRQFILRSPRSGRALASRVERLVAENWGPGATAPSRHRSLVLDRALLATLLDGVEPFRPRTPDPGRRVAARQLEQFLRDRFRRPVSIRDACEELGVAVRTAEQGFQEAFGISPRSYLSLLRLNAARAALRRPSGDSVSGIAAAAGLPHAGRFSVGYRRLFGESPRDTVARAIPRGGVTSPGKPGSKAAP